MEQSGLYRLNVPSLHYFQAWKLRMRTIMDLGIVCFSVHILLPILQNPEAIWNASNSPAFQERGTDSVLPMACFLFRWLVLVYFLCFLISRVFRSSGSCGGLYKYDDIECSFGDHLLPQLLFLVCDCLNYSLLLAPSWPWRANSSLLLANESACPHWLSRVWCLRPLNYVS